MNPWRWLVRQLFDRRAEKKAAARYAATAGNPHLAGRSPEEHQAWLAEVRAKVPPLPVEPSGPFKGTTTDRNDPGLQEVDPFTGMQSKYLVLSEEERAKGFVRPVRRKYLHLVCGTVTTMGQAIAESYARSPVIYSGTMCVHCKGHFPVGPEGEFIWDDGSDEKVGT